MEEEELEVDVLGGGGGADYAYMSTSAEELAVHSQWLLDSPTTSTWCETLQPSPHTRRRVGRVSTSSDESVAESKGKEIIWTDTERRLLHAGMEKYERNTKKLAELVTTKTEAEIRTLIEAEHGIHLEAPSVVRDKILDEEGTVPSYAIEEVVMDVPDCIEDVMSLINTAKPTIPSFTHKPQTENRKVFKNKVNAVKKSRNNLLKPDVLKNARNFTSPRVFDTGGKESYLSNELLIRSTESDHDTQSHLITSQISKIEKANHRRKYSLSVGPASKSGHSKSKFNISLSMQNRYSKKIGESKSPAKNRNRKASEVMSTGKDASPKLQIVLGSGQALPVSAGEQVIKIEKKQEDSDSDVDIDIESGDEGKEASARSAAVVGGSRAAERTTQRNFEPARKRQKKIILDGEGGYTIMHTEAGDLYERATEPRKEKVAKKQAIHLIHCKHFNTEKPAPYAVRLMVSALLSMDMHAHGSRAEVMGLVGGELRAGVLHLRAYHPCAAAADHTHCDMCPVSQARAAEALSTEGHAVVGWHHSHPRFAAQPSALDLRTQRALQNALERHRAPFLGVITSQYWPTGRNASQYKCLRVESEGPEYEDMGYQFSVKLIPDLTTQNLPDFLVRLREIAQTHTAADKFAVNMSGDICPDAAITYLEKCLSSVRHHLTSAGYTEQDLTFKELLKGIKDIFR